ncbi:MAG: hypothetical protein E3J78_02905 [Candidatus Cloacimonadota bacterium]|nr:MAG: hypothetical protein E3J78_02905 [Candidatus Cloacimonadota bacterium]
MVKKITVLLFILSIAAIPIVAQDYSFTVDKNYSALYINSDGTCTVSYEIQFTCDENAHIIDIVDIGMPNEWYELKTASASIDGHALKKIRHSEYVHPGVEVHLGAYEIVPGETGTVLFAITVTNMIFPDSEDEAYVSVVFSPTWYGSQFAHGTTDHACYIIFPPGVKPEEPKYHKKKFSEAAVDSAGRAWYLFSLPHASPSKQYTYGVSFPREYIPDNAIVTSTPKKFSIGGVISSFFIGLISLVTGSCPCIIIGFFIFIAIIGVINSSKRKMKYLPPALSVEGVGIKRGLTAVESAILLELPLNKVATMILFGLIKKRITEVKKQDPLTLEITERDKEKLYDYEKDFMKAIGEKGKLIQKKLKSTLVNLIKAVNKKTKGFSRKKTRQYYRGILNRAWVEIRAANTPELKSKTFDKNLEWLLMDDNYKSKMGETFSGTNIIAPLWWGHYQPAYARSTAGISPTGMKPSSVSMPTLPGAQFANSMVSGIEGFANKIVSNITGFQTSITSATNPVPVSSRSGGWSSSGGGCACACACAGCACACAGGGR